MKHISSSRSLGAIAALATLCLVPATSWGQAASAGSPRASVQGQNKNSLRYHFVSDLMPDANMSETLKKPVELDAREMPVLDAIKKVLEQAGISYDIAEEVKTEEKVTMTLKNVPVSTVLMILTRQAKLGWIYEKKDDKENIKIVQGLSRSPRTMVLGGPDVRIEVPDVATIQSYVAEAQQAASLASRLAMTEMRELQNSYLIVTNEIRDKLNTRVKLDVRDADVRETLKKLLEQAKVDYVLEDDVPTGEKRSFTFENTPLDTALDVVTKSVEIGWRMETPRVPRSKDDKKDDKPEIKPLIRIGKKHAGAVWRLAPAMPTNKAGSVYRTVPAPPNPPSVTVAPVLERRSTFTCPHCKQKTTIVGSKDGNGKLWKFCPMCGKEITRESLRESHGNPLFESHIHDDFVRGLPDWNAYPLFFGDIL
ncbi:MAG: hypothetical protein OHK0029_09560 [Armatimonadaceae bacterium]